MNKRDERIQAVALRYNKEREHSPRLVGKGSGYVADELIKRAKDADIPIQRDPSLVGILSQLELNQQIPTELYDVVAEVFAFIYKVDQHS